ncbi:MAG: hypothetical protein HY924_08765 [Elusimicrobia bacterium]|nr:hypothetical protein [Elusimicrobiota bacterium]
MSGRPASRLVWNPMLWAGLVFLILMFRPAYIAVLRAGGAEASPQEWVGVHTDGSFAVLLPELLHSRWYDEANYAARVQQVLLHDLPYSPYWAEFREPEHWLAGLLTYYILAAPAYLLGGDLNLAWLVTGALTGAAWFLLLHAVLRWWSGSDTAALPLALFSVLFPDVYFWLLDINLHWAVVQDRLLTTFFQQGSLVLPYFRRLPSYYLTFLLSCLLFLGAWHLSQSPERRPVGSVLIGLGFGLMSLVHYFEFAYGMAVLGLFAGAVLLSGPSRLNRWNIAVCLAAALTASAGYVLLQVVFVQTNLLSRAPDLAAIEHTRRPTPMAAVHLLLGGALWWAAKREADPGKRSAWLLLAAAQAAAFCARNGQVLTGWTAQPFHFIPMASFMGCAALFSWVAARLGRASWWTPGLAAAAVLVVAGWGLANEAVAARRTYRFCGHPSGVEAGYAWVRANLPKDGLVLTPSMTANTGLPLYTAAKVEVPPISAPVLIFYTKEEYLRRVARMLKTCRVDVERFISERWLLPGPAEELRRRASAAVNAAGRIDPDILEPSQWFFVYSYMDRSDDLVLRGRARLRELYASEAPLEGRFWVWLNDRDRPLVVEQPEAWGAKKVFQVPGVSIYEHVPGARPAAKGGKTTGKKARPKRGPRKP